MTSDRDLLQALFVQQLGFAPASEVMAAGAQVGGDAALAELIPAREAQLH